MKYLNAKRQWGVDGCTQSNTGPMVLLKGTCLIICVDDIIIIRYDKEEINALKEQLSHEFQMNNLGKHKYFLGIFWPL